MGKYFLAALRQGVGAVVYTVSCLVQGKHPDDVEAKELDTGWTLAVIFAVLFALSVLWQ